MNAVYRLFLLVSVFVVTLMPRVASADEKPRKLPSVRVAEAARFVVGKRVAGALLTRAGEKRVAKGNADRAYAHATIEKANQALHAAQSMPQGKERKFAEQQAKADKRYASSQYEPRGAWRIDTGSAMVRAGRAMRPGK